MSHPYGYLLRILHWCNSQTINAALEEMELTSAQGHIMGYITHRASPPCPRDIEEEFHLSHPTVSGLLSRLEQKGFIQLYPDPEDHRRKRVRILDRGIQCSERIHQTLQDNERRIVSGFTPQEQAIFQDLLQRAITNMGGDLCRRNPKEEANK